MSRYAVVDCSNTPDPELEVIARVTQVIDTEGRLAAIRYLRRRARRLGVVQARAYVLAVEAGATPHYRITGRA